MGVRIGVFEEPQQVEIMCTSQNKNYVQPLFRYQIKCDTERVEGCGAL